MPAPSISDTFLVRGPLYLYNISLGKFLNKQTPAHTQWEATGGEDSAEDDATNAINSAIAPNANGESRKRKTKNKS